MGTEEAPKPVRWGGFVACKYQWDADKDVQGEAISKYSWSDGKKTVSIYIELEGLDDLADDDFVVNSGEREVSMGIAALAGKRRKFTLANLAEDIDGVKLVRKKGKSTVVLKLQKKEEQSWYKLLESSSKGGDDDDGGAGGMPGGMGGMDMASMMGGMGGGGMGGMDMASMM